MNNLKTTIFGAVAALGLFFTAQSNPVLHLIGVCLSAVGAFLTGAAAQDATTPKS
jgi:hypothetical protein